MLSALAFSFIFANLAIGSDGHGPPGTRDNRIPACGKLRSLMSRPDVRPLEPPDPAYLETLADTDVLHYVLDIEVSALSPGGSTCWLAGSNVISIQSKSAALSEFSIRLRNQYSVDAAYIDGATAVTVTTTSETTRVVTLDRVYGLDETFTLTIEYSGNTVHLPTAHGSITVDTQPDGRPVVATLSQPYYAYSWWPVKEGDVGAPGDHADKATMEFAITAPDTMSVPCNGLLQGVDVLTGNRKRHRWASDYPIIPSLVSFAATEYNTWTSSYSHPGGTMPVEFYIYPAWDNASNRAKWEKCVDMIGVYASLFGEYPFVDEKYGIYNFPWAGLEHQTMTAQGAEGGYTGFGEYLTAHELAHQWFGDAVTCKTWNHIWLNEGIGSYADALWEEFKSGGSLADLQDTMAWRRQYIGTNSSSVYVPDIELGDEGEIFNPATTYYKGSWAMHMLRRMMGDEAFFTALRAYFAAYEYKAATTEDLQAVFEGYYPGGDLSWFFSEWIYGQGSPVYSWGWEAVDVGGRHYVLLSIDQTQSGAYPRFTMPIDIVVDGTRHVVFNDADPEYFVIPVASAPSTVQFDPDVWILRGSAGQASYVSGPPTIVETSPAPGEQVAPEAMVDSVTITFHTTVNLTASDLSLVGVNTGSKAFTIASGTNVNPVVLQLDSPLGVDTYTLTVTDGVSSSISGRPLDGEIIDSDDAASLPSGDGVPGGDAIIRFVVVGSAIPAVSTWAQVVMTLLILTAGTLVLSKEPTRPLAAAQPD